jgi:hypothetical protein
MREDRIRGYRKAQNGTAQKSGTTARADLQNVQRLAHRLCSCETATADFTSRAILLKQHQVRSGEFEGPHACEARLRGTALLIPKDLHSFRNP